MATIMREVEFEFDEGDAVAYLSGATLVNALINNEGVDVVLDEISNDDIINYLLNFDEIHAFTSDEDYRDSAVAAVVADADLLERVLHAVPLSTLAEVLENMEGTV